VPRDDAELTGAARTTRRDAVKNRQRMTSGPRLRVCHLTSAHSALDPRIFHKECRTLARAGYDVVLVGRHDGPADLDGVRLRPIPATQRGLKGRLVCMLRVYRAALRERADVYHLHDPELIPVGLLLKLRTGARIVYDMHEYFSEVIPARSGRTVGRRLRRAFWHMLLERVPIRFFDLTVFPTVSLAGEFGRLPRSVVLQNLPLVDAGECGEQRRDADHKEYDVVFVGAISEPRLRFTLSVAERLAARRPGFRWLFVGLRESMKRWIVDNYDGSFVRRHLVLVERVPHETVLSYLARSRVGFNYHPLEKRFLVAIPMKVFEYMLFSVPAVTTALPELKRLLKDGEEAVLVESDDPADYADAVSRLLSDAAAARSIGAAGEALIRTRLNWEHSEAGKMLDAYEQLRPKNRHA